MSANICFTRSPAPLRSPEASEPIASATPLMVSAKPSKPATASIATVVSTLMLLAMKLAASPKTAEDSPLLSSSSVSDFRAGESSAATWEARAFDEARSLSRLSLNSVAAATASPLSVIPSLSASASSSLMPSRPRLRNGTRAAPLLPKISMARALFDAPSCIPANFSARSPSTWSADLTWPAESFTFTPSA